MVFVAREDPVEPHDDAVTIVPTKDYDALLEALEKARRDVEAMDMLRRLQRDAGWSGWSVADDFTIEPCYVGGDSDPASAILFSSEIAAALSRANGGTT